MPRIQPRPSTGSSNPKTTNQGGTGGGGRSARAHRDDTPEARAQQASLPKTHPTANAGSRAARRKDK